MAEEHRCQAPPEGLRLCANNCGFFGCPATLNLCSKCYRDLRLKEDQASSAKIAVEKSLLASSSSSSLSFPTSVAAAVDSPMILKDSRSGGEEATDLPSSPAAAEEEQQQRPPPASQPSRCTACRKRIGLTGFRCRCGESFCGVHRYPEQHKCTFDFKAAGKEAIARANPVVKADKLQKI